MAILRVKLRPEEERRSPGHHDDDVARGLVQAEHDSTKHPNRSHIQTPTNGNGADDEPSPKWQQFEWRLLPYTPVGRALVSATQRLEDGGSSTANLDAQVILAHVLGVDRSWLFAHYDYKLMPAEATCYSELVARRTASEPVAYIVGKKEFYGLELAVDRRVLIPRPETELVVDAVLDYVESHSDRHISVADVGTGSGAIALAVATNCAEVTVYATDISEEAFAVARQNVSRWDERKQVVLLKGDLLQPLPHKVDVIAGNLPYIRSDEYASLQRDVREYEPQLALEAGPEGLDVFARLLQQIPSHIMPGGVIYLEIAYDQGDVMVELVQKLLPGVRDVSVRQDYHGRDRLLLAAM